MVPISPGRTAWRADRESRTRPAGTLRSQRSTPADPTTASNRHHRHPPPVATRAARRTCIRVPRARTPRATRTRVYASGDDANARTLRRAQLCRHPRRRPRRTRHPQTGTGLFERRRLARSTRKPPRLVRTFPVLSDPNPPAVRASSRSGPAPRVRDARSARDARSTTTPHRSSSPALSRERSCRERSFPSRRDDAKMSAYDAYDSRKTRRPNRAPR